MSTLSTREHQMFPVLNAVQIATAKRFASGPERHFAAGESVYAIGEQGVPAWLVLEGTIDVVRRDGLSREAPITIHRVGQLSGEVNQLAARSGTSTSTHGGIGGCG